jgi:thiol-disulfide isomerase/thioredoxin
MVTGVLDNLMPTAGIALRRILAFGVGLGLAIVCSGASADDPPPAQHAPASSPTGTTGNDSLDVAGLVREVRAGEQWIYQVGSLHLRLTGQWTKTPEGLAERRAELRNQSPDASLDAEHFPGLRAQSTEALEFGFDRTRLACSKVGTGAYDHWQVWDGAEYRVKATSYPGGRVSYLFGREPEGGIHIDLVWPIAGPPAFWWSRDEAKAGFAAPEDFVLVRREPFHGVDCYVLMAPMPDTTWYVGVADHRLHGHARGWIRPWARERAQQVLFEVARSLGSDATDTKGLEAWTEAQPAETRQAVKRAARVRCLPLSQPWVVKWFDEYREIAPGCWLPGRQGYAFISVAEDGREYETSRRELTVTEAQVNGALDPALFDLQPTEEGAVVLDQRGEVPLSYKVKKDRTAEEWQQLRAEASERAAQDSSDQRYRDSLIGKTAPAFPAGVPWLNSPALTWADLKGNVVVLDFWADSCGPCRNDFAKLAKMHQAGAQTGIAVIGIHIAGANLDSVRAVLKTYDMQYPIMIDAPNPEMSWGQLFGQYRVNAMPYVFLVDANGQIAAHGQLDDLLALAHKLRKAGAEAHE